mmetsp:Transcript_14450/g.34205  ORF Transcript_14450/g.34205 Transcript_14450/m.34205 type:complete len:232 (-) Transcript_14450:190-885(-)
MRSNLSSTSCAQNPFSCLGHSILRSSSSQPLYESVGVSASSLRVNGWLRSPLCTCCLRRMVSRMSGTRVGCPLCISSASLASRRHPSYSSAAFSWSSSRRFLWSRTPLCFACLVRMCLNICSTLRAHNPFSCLGHSISRASSSQPLYESVGVSASSLRMYGWLRSPPPPCTCCLKSIVSRMADAFVGLLAWFSSIWLASTFHPSYENIVSSPFVSVGTRGTSSGPRADAWE